VEIKLIGKHNKRFNKLIYLANKVDISEFKKYKNEDGYFKSCYANNKIIGPARLANGLLYNLFFKFNQKC
jgi:hypothetical protein